MRIIWYKSTILRSNDRTHEFEQLNRNSLEEDRYAKQIAKDKENKGE